MRLLHTSDWHLGMTFRAGITYAEDQRYAIRNICDIALKEQVDGIIIAGDVFDKGNPTNEGMRMYDEIMTYICGELNIPVYMIAGNHDGADRISQCNELLKKSGLYIVGKLRREPQVIQVGDVDIYMLPWISTDKVRTIYPETADTIESMEDAYKCVLDKYRERFIPGHKNILVSHAFIVNAETSTSDKSAEIGHATMVGSYVFDGFDYVALGHLHGPQSINEHIRYSGTPMAYSFGKEESQEKSVTILDTDTMEQRVIPVENLRKRVTISGNYDDIVNGTYDEETREAYVRVEATDVYVGLERMTELRSIFPHLLETSGKSFENENEKITMTIDEYEHVQDTPEKLFARFCEDVVGEAPSEHMMELFDVALAGYEKEVQA